MFRFLVWNVTWDFSEPLWNPKKCYIFERSGSLADFLGFLFVLKRNNFASICDWVGFSHVFWESFELPPQHFAFAVTSPSGVPNVTCGWLCAVWPPRFISGANLQWIPPRNGPQGIGASSITPVIDCKNSKWTMVAPPPFPRFPIRRNQWSNEWNPTPSSCKNISFGAGIQKQWLCG